MNNDLGSLVRRFANYFTRDFVTRENYWQIASLVTQKSLFTVTHALFFIAWIYHKTSLMVCQVTGWCRQATNLYLNQCWLSSRMAYGVSMSRWVKTLATVKHRWYYKLSLIIKQAALINWKSIIFPMSALWLVHGCHWWWRQSKISMVSWQLLDRNGAFYQALLWSYSSYLSSPVPLPSLSIQCFPNRT